MMTFMFTLLILVSYTACGLVCAVLEFILNKESYYYDSDRTLIKYFIIAFVLWPFTLFFIVCQHLITKIISNILSRIPTVDLVKTLRALISKENNA